MKHAVTKLQAPNELIMFIITILGNYCFNTFFREFSVEESSVPNNVVSDIMFYNHEPTPGDEEYT